MGDVTITYDRAKTVEFTFFTLVDSEAFVTHRPSKLNEAFALIRPFQWQVGDIFDLFIFLMQNLNPVSNLSGLATYSMHIYNIRPHIIFHNRITKLFNENKKGFERKEKIIFSLRLV